MITDLHFWANYPFKLQFTNTIYSHFNSAYLKALFNEIFLKTEYLLLIIYGTH